VSSGRGNSTELTTPSATNRQYAQLPSGSGPGTRGVRALFAEQSRSRVAGSAECFRGS
jgi:hypothetical protein